MRSFSKSIAIAALAALAGAAHAGDKWVSLGAANQSDGGGASVAFGWRTASGLGIEIGAVFNSEFNSSNLIDYPVPHNNFTNLGVKRTSSTFGADVAYFFQVSEEFSPYVEGGLYYSPRGEIARSNATGLYYKQSSKSELIPSAGVGVQFKIQKDLILGAGFHTVRGANIVIGKNF